ncbi:MAG: hypothetical protein IJ428_00090 [Clostridia bacterium]|nr:hypothetical protein [Clostridia bacterium]
MIKKLKKRRLDTFMLAVALFTVSGACLAYNLHTAESGEIAVSLSELVYYDAVKASAISDAAAANLFADDSIPAAVEPSAPPHTYELLPPIVTPPQ